MIASGPSYAKNVFYDATDLSFEDDQYIIMDQGPACFGRPACDAAWHYLNDHPRDLRGAVNLAANYCFDHPKACAGWLRNAQVSDDLASFAYAFGGIEDANASPEGTNPYGEDVNSAPPHEPTAPDVRQSNPPSTAEVAPETRSTDGLGDLAARRAALGAPPAGPGVSPTLSRLDVEGMDSLYGTSGHGQPISLIVNPISRTHAETDVLQQLADLGGANGAPGTMYIDYPAGLCGACGRSGAVRSMAGQVGLSQLTVIWPGGSIVLIP